MFRINSRRRYKNICIELFFLGMLTVILGNSFAHEVLLRSPGKRPVKDPFVIIPFDQLYPNQPPNLPEYRNALGNPINGWAVKYIDTRRFSSNQSALIYYQVSDLARSKVINITSESKVFRIWPPDTIIVLETYEGDVHSQKGSNLLSIDAIKKMDTLKDSSKSSFFPVNWSYARFSREGKLSITAHEIKECHQCHSIAFRITGDLVFTPFP